MKTKDVYVLIFYPDIGEPGEIQAVFETREAAEARMEQDIAEMEDEALFSGGHWDIERHYLHLTPSLANPAMEPEKTVGDSQ